MEYVRYIRQLVTREIAEKGISVREIARRSGVSYQTLYAIMSMKVNNLHHKTRALLATYFGPLPSEEKHAKQKERFDHFREVAATGNGQIELDETRLIDETMMTKAIFYAGGDDPPFAFDDLIRKYSRQGYLVVPIGDTSRLSPRIRQTIHDLLTYAEIHEIINRRKREKEAADEERDAEGDQAAGK